jgi:hypothetical protein
MSYDKSDFVLMKIPTGPDVLINIPKIKFVIEKSPSECSLYFGGGEDDYIIVKGSLDDIMESL